MNFEMATLQKNYSPQSYRPAHDRNAQLSQNRAVETNRFCNLDIQVTHNRTKATKDKAESNVFGGYGVAALLVATLGILLCIVGHANHLGDANGIESSECL
jgi:hypothetical protein